MQVKTQNPEVSAGARSVERVWGDFQIEGNTLPETRAERKAEEKTHATELLALVSGQAVIAREFYFDGQELLDEYDYSLSGVLKGGVEDAKRKVECGKTGAQKELRRREIEEANLNTIINLSVGSACIETSGTDNSWTNEEKKEHGYNGDTLVRVTARVTESRFLQYNIILPHSELKALNRGRKIIRPDDKKMLTAEEMLANPQIVPINTDNPEESAQVIQASFKRALLRTHPGRAVLDMVKSVRRKQKDAWKYVSDYEQDDIFEALIDKFELIARKTPPEEWEAEANIARGGAWQLLIERYLGKTSKHENPIAADSIRKAGERAAAAGAVFIACGGSVDMKSLAQVPEMAERAVIAHELMSNIAGFGTCRSCHREDEVLFGCGAYCGGCNRTWCYVYVLTGRQLEDEEILPHKYMNYSRGLGFSW